MFNMHAYYGLYFLIIATSILPKSVTIAIIFYIISLIYTYLAGNFKGVK